MADMNEDQDLLAGDVWQFLDEEAPRLIAHYFSKFDGRRFNAIGGGGDSPTLMNHFDSSDLVAVSTLSVNIPGSAAIEILETRARKLNSLLAQIPNDVAVHEADKSVLSEGSPAWELWKQLKAIDGMGPVLTDKLLARKRPHLLPVYDSVVKAAIQPRAQRYWIPLWNEFRQSDGALVGHLERVRELSDVAAEDASLLRVLDVAIWMRNRRDSNNQLPFKSREPLSGSLGELTVPTV